MASTALGRLAITILSTMAGLLVGEEKIDAPFRATDFGPSLNWTYQVAEDHIVYKGIAIQVDDAPGGIANSTAWMVYDQDTMSCAAAWVAAKDGSAPRFINWRGVAFDGSHNTHAAISGRTVFVNRPGPGYANPANGSFEDLRYLSPVDQKRYGPLPRSWAHFTGLYRTGKQVVIAYRIGDTEILEKPGFDAESGVFSRTFFIAQSRAPLTMRVAPEQTALAVTGLPKQVLGKTNGNWLLQIPASPQPLRFTVLLSDGAQDRLDSLAGKTTSAPIETLRGGTATWTEVITTTIARGESAGGFSSDILTLPEKNPWNSKMRTGGFDFFADGRRAAVCTWNGDVWLVDGVNGNTDAKLSWKRIASGLFQPLGVKIVKDAIYVSCRDQIVRLIDANGDGETDFYENFNNDHQVTEHFHEFVMGLQTDQQGNFYYAKSARHALPGLIPQHGTLMRVSADGLTSTIMATGFRAANGVCVNADGSFYVTDQEGHWTPKNRINWVTEGGFYGNMNTLVKAGQSSDDNAMDPAMVWITNNFDRSPGELVHIDSPSWGALNGNLLNASYGTGKVFLVLQETVGKLRQSGVVPLPVRFPTGVMRGRFHPGGDFYTCGLFGWAGNATRAGGFYRIRATGLADLPVSLSATKSGLVIGFAQPLDQESATNADSYLIKAWDIKRSANYGSKHVNERPLDVRGAELLPDGKTVRILIDGLAPTWCMSIRLRLKTKDGRPLDHEIHNTINALKP